jgi:hypothetical protein
VIGVGQQLALRRKRFFEWKGNEGNAVKTGGNIHLGARVGVDLPGTAQLGTAFQQHKIVAALLLQAHRGQQPGKAGADDDGLNVERLHLTHCGHVHASVGVGFTPNLRPVA